MTINVGTIDRIARALLGVVLLILPFAQGWGTLGTVISVIVGLVMLTVAATRSCPLYTVLGVKTCQSPDGTA